MGLSCYICKIIYLTNKFAKYLINFAIHYNFSNVFFFDLYTDLSIRVDVLFVTPVCKLTLFVGFSFSLYKQIYLYCLVQLSTSTNIDVNHILACSVYGIKKMSYINFLTFIYVFSLYFVLYCSRYNKLSLIMFMNIANTP